MSERPVAADAEGAVVPTGAATPVLAEDGLSQREINRKMAKASDSETVLRLVTEVCDALTCSAERATHLPL